MKNSKLKKDTNLFYKYIENNLVDELRVIVVGHERCNPHKMMEGPMIKNRYIVHFCVKGKGFYSLNGKTHKISAGDLFFIPVNNIISYYPDPSDPWEYYWFEYTGHLASKLSSRAFLTEKTPVRKAKKPAEMKEMFMSMISDLNDKTDDLIVVSYIYKFFSAIIAEKEPKQTTLKSAKDVQLKKIFDFIHANYSKTDLSLTEIAKHVNMNPSYLSRFFKDLTKVTISSYIIEFRLQKAAVLLKRRDLSVKSIAISVGYSDPLYFTREFRRLYNNSPTNYRKEIILKDPISPLKNQP